MAHITLHAPRPMPLLGRLAAWFAHSRAKAALRGGLQELNGLSDHMLRAIGIDREEVRTEMSRLEGRDTATRLYIDAISRHRE